jgi:hypothetical protein
MTTSTHADTPAGALPGLLTEAHARTLDAMAALFQANHRVALQLVELSTSAAKEGVRTCAELQSAALDTARAHARRDPDSDSTAARPQDPLAWYDTSLDSTTDGARRAFTLFQTSAQIVTRSAERLQTSAQRAAQEMQEAFAACVSRMQELSRG